MQHQKNWMQVTVLLPTAF